MKNHTRFFRIIAIGVVIIVGVGLILAGCATTVPIKSVKLPTIDTSNVKKLGIKPFENKSGVSSSDGVQLTQYLTDQTTQKIMALNKFEIVSPTDPNADGIFTGEVRSITAKESQSEYEGVDKDGNPYVIITYRRDVDVEFIYYIVDTRKNMPIGQVSRKNSTYSSEYERSKLSSTLALAKRIVDSELRRLEQDVVPTIVSTNRKLMTETSKDKAVKQLMNMAQALVKDGNLEEAIKQYDDIAANYGSVAARTNANIIREAISSDIAANARLAQLLNDKDSLANKAVKSTVDALNSKLPSGSNIMVMKSNSTERDMIDAVMDQIIKNVVQGGKLTVIDRSNQALINAEQQYQLSGNVSDETAVSLGRQLGVKYATLCWISGTMSSRRLNVRVLNIETAAIAVQDDFEI